MSRANCIVLDKIEIMNLVKFAETHEDTDIIILESSGTCGVGENIYAICGKCFTKEDITDYGCW